MIGVNPLLLRHVQGFDALDWLSAWPVLPASGGTLLSLSELGASNAIFQGQDWSNDLKKTLIDLGCRQASLICLTDERIRTQLLHFVQMLQAYSVMLTLV
jgi:hypothetical protein